MQVKLPKCKCRPNQCGTAHFRKFKAKYLLEYPENNEDLNTVINNLKCSEYPILEKLNLMLIYRALSKGENIVEKSKRIKTTCSDFILKKENQPKYYDIYKHFNCVVFNML